MRKTIMLLLGIGLVMAAPAEAQMGHMHNMWQRPDTAPADSSMAQGWQPGMARYPGMMGMGYGGRMGPSMMGGYFGAHGLMGGAGMGMMIAYGLPSPGVILGMQDDLGLSDAQVSQLESLQRNVQETLRADLTSAEEAWEQASSILESATPDLHAYEQKLQEVSTERVDAQVAVANASVQARSILTQEQLQKVRDGISMLQGMFQGPPARARRGQGVMGGSWNRGP